MRLLGKSALVTGAAQGIGKAIALRFGAEGASVVLMDVQEERGRGVAETIRAAGGKAVFAHGDVTRARDAECAVQAAVEGFGKLDILVCNAGYIQGDHELPETTEEEWRANLDGSLTATFLCCRAALPELTRQGGSIVNVSSVNAIMGLHFPSYSAAKGGIIALSRELAVQVGPQNVRVNVICPGTIATEALGAFYDARPQYRDQVKQFYPLRRFGTPEEVAACALYLASDEAAFATGAVFVLDGGLSAGREFPFTRDE